MSDLFISVLNMSISASYIVLAVLLLRLVFKKAPGWITVLLWGVVALRLIFPFSVESVLSLIPSASTVSPDVMTDKLPAIDSGIPIINSAVNPMLGTAFSPDPAESVNPLQVVIPVLAAVWLVGAAVLTVYTAVSYIRLKKRIGTAVLLADNIYQSESVISPFVLGLFKPRIYIPFNMNERDMPHVIAHETAHIKRRDHIWKPLGFLLLTIHWFNPLMWLAYVLLCRDIEVACDQKVISKLDGAQKADYSEALLSCSVNRRMIAACPLAFGEVGVKARVRSVLSYKKPAVWIIAASSVILAVLAVCFLTDPVNKDLSVEASVRESIDEKIKEHFASEETKDRAACTSWSVLGKKEKGGVTTLYVHLMYAEYSRYGESLKREYAFDTPARLTYTEKDGIFTLDIWTPEDGAGYSDSIRRNFPLRLHSRAFDTSSTSARREEDCVRQAKLCFGLPVIDLKPSASVEVLRQKYPHFFGLDGKNGLAVYVWQLAKDSYSCYLKSADDEYMSPMLPPEGGAASISEMRTILLTYDVSREMIYLRPTVAIWSSYAYNIDDDYKKELEILFWSDISDSASFAGYDSISFDIDGDGEDESCYLLPGHTSGLFTFRLEIKNKKGETEYETAVYSDPSEPYFEVDENGELKIFALSSEGAAVYDIYVTEGELSLKQSPLKMLTLADVKRLKELHGRELTWEHFSGFYSRNVGSGLYILRYPINRDYSLLIGGAKEASPDYIYLVSNRNSRDYIELREDIPTVEGFLTATFDPAVAPDTFSFSLTWGCYGTSTYDSRTGKLVKSTVTPNTEDFTAEYFLTEEELNYVYSLINSLGMNGYPDTYDPDNGLSEPSLTLILTARFIGSDKTVKAEDVSISGKSSNEMGQKFLDVCAAISELIENSEAWKALPEAPPFE